MSATTTHSVTDEHTSVHAANVNGTALTTPDDQGSHGRAVDETSGSHLRGDLQVIDAAGSDGTTHCRREGTLQTSDGRPVTNLDHHQGLVAHRTPVVNGGAAHGPDDAPDRTGRAPANLGHQGGHDTQAMAVTNNPVVHQVDDDAQAAPVGDRDTFTLRLATETLADIEKLRIAVANRIGAAERDGYSDEPAIERLRMLLTEAIQPLEHQCTLDVQRAVRQHPLGAWVKATIGIGEKQGARLIAAIGDPAWNHMEDRPRRGPAELWAFCGFRPDQRKRRGERANWNHEAKMRAYLCAESCMKQMHSPYRADYDRAKAAWAGRDTTDMHKHNHALRVVAKAILRDMWKASRTP